MDVGFPTSSRLSLFFSCYAWSVVGMGRFSFIYLFTLTPVWGGVEAVLHYVFLPTVMAPWVIGRVGRPAWKVSHLRIANRTVLDEIISSSFLVFFTAEAWRVEAEVGSEITR